MRTATVTKPPVLDYSGREAVNLIGSNLSFMGKEMKCILLTSSVAGEGKTTMAARIAVNLTERSNNNVLLIDADMRRSRLAGELGLTTEGEMTGLTHFLAGKCELEDAVYQTDIPGLYVIPAGRDVINPVQLITSSGFKELMDWAREQFDMILVDTPPIGLVVDAVEVAKYCDGSAVVVEYGKRRRHELQRTVEQLNKSGTPVIGCIIDKVTTKTLMEKQYYKSHYYYGKYSHYYGADKRKG